MIIRDPIHGDIELGGLERRLIDVPEMQRLRRIKQTGTADLVYPGCRHTRFEHSLGTYAVARRILASLRQNGTTVTEDDEAVVGAAALIHDITHLPFGHTFEDERRIFSRHDQGQRFLAFLAPGTGINRVLRELGLLEPIKAIFTGQYNGPRWHKQIIASCIDADLLDYLRRDSYFAGLKQDYDDRILSYLTLDEDDLVINMAKHNLDRADARSEVLHLLRMRYFLTERVYTHHAKVASGAMISKAVELAVENGLREQHLYGAGDDELLLWLRDGSPELIGGVMERRLYKRAYVLSSANGLRDQLIKSYGQSAAERRRLEEQIANRVGVHHTSIVVQCPPATFFKEAGALVRTTRGVHRLNEPGHLPLEIAALEEQYQRLWRFYVFTPAHLAAEVARTCQGIFGEPSEYLAGIL
ncbi:MAG: HD domain-containing protein [Bacillota bacterium]